MTDPRSSIPADALLRQAGFLRALARGLLGDEHHGEDVVQATWLSALEGPAEPVRNPRAWMARVAGRVALRLARSEGRRADRERAAARPEALPSAAETVEREHTLRAVTDAVLALDEPWRATILARYFEGLEAREIAERDGLPLPTVRSRIARAHELLRARLDREHGGDRRAWSLGLVALVGGERLGLVGAGVGAATGVTAGALVVSTQLKTAAFSLAVLLGMLGVWFATSALFGGGPPEPLAAAPSVTLAEAVLETDAQAEVDAPLELAAGADARAAAPVEPATAAATGSVLLRVRWSDGTPAAGVVVKAHPWGAAEPFLASFYARTDGAGEVRLKDLPPGDVGLYAQRGGFARGTVVAGVETRAELVLRAGLEVSGRVVDLQGAPVPDAEVWLSDAGNGSRGVAVDRSDANGRFVLRDVSDQNSVSARKEGYGPAPSFWIDGGAGDERELLLVLQGRGAALALHVVDPAGAPVEGARVRLVSKEFQARGYEPGTGKGRGRPIPYLLVSDADGRCEGASLLGGETEVLVSTPGLAPFTETIELPEGRREVLEVTLLEGVVLEGVVHTTEGEPLAGATVRVGGYGDIGTRTTISAADGRYRLAGVAPGEVEVAAFLKGAGRDGATLSGADGETLAWDARIDAGRVLRGRLVDEDGDGLANWMVNVGTGGHGWDGPSEFRGQTRSDEEGRFAIVNCPEGALWAHVIEVPFVSVFPEAEWDDLVADGEEREYVIPDDWRGSAYLVGRTLDTDGRGTSAQLTLRHPARDRAHVVWSDADTGAFRIGPLPPETYGLELEDASERFAARLEDLRLVRGATLDVGAVALGGPGRLALELRLAEGVDLERVQFTVATPVPESRFVAHLRGVDAAAGLELPVGAYELRVFGMVPSREVPFTIEPGATTSLELDLEVGARVALNFDLPTERGLPLELELVFRDADGREVRRTAYLDAQEGVPAEYATWVLCTLPPADGYTLEVAGPGGLQGSAVVDAARMVLGDGPSSGPPLTVVLR